jgi:AraC-like DNA-binding protein
MWKKRLIDKLKTICKRLIRNRHSDKQFSQVYNPKRRVLFRYLVTYLIIITVLFVVIGTFSYANIVKTEQEKVKIETGQVVDTVVDSIETNLQSVLKIQSSFYIDLNVSRLRKLGADFEPKEFMRFLRMSNNLAMYTSTSLFLDRLTIYYHFNHLFIASDMLDNRPEIFFKLKLSNENKLYTQWREEQLQKINSVFFVTKDSPNGYVDLYYRLPFTDTAKGATVIAGLKLGELIHSLGIYDIYDDSALILLDSEDHILYASQDKAIALENLMAEGSRSTRLRLGNENFEWWSQRLSLLDWTVIYYVPTDSIYADSRRVQRELISLYLIVLLTSIFLAFIFSKRISDPVASLLRLVGDWEKKNGISLAPKGGNDLRYVLGKMSDMTKDYSQLATRIQEYRDSSREIIYNRLLKGELILEDEMRMMEGEVSILDYSYYSVAAARIMAFDNGAVNVAMFRVSEVLSRMREKGLFFCKTAFDKFVVTMCFESMPSKEQIEDSISHIVKVILTDSSANLKWGIGDTVMNHDQIFMSYRNAEYVLYNMNMLGSNDIAWYDSSASKKNRLTYSLDDAQRLCNIISSGDSNAAMQAIKELFERNKDVLEASKVQRNRFIFLLSETALLLESKITDLNSEKIKEIELNLKNMKGAKDIDEIMQYMSTVINIYCLSVDLRNNDKYQRLKDKIIVYIEENYNDPNLGLASIASSLCMTESYISSFFKQSNGTNIHRYIEQKRMSRAVELLKGTALSTAEIADQVGYSNINTFYKAFKRCYGITPRGYKEDGK